MRHRCSAILVPFLLMFAVSQLNAQDRFWRPYTEWEVRGGDPVWAGQGSLFLPLHQTEVNMLFADFRGNWTDTEAAHGNLGLAFRQMLIYDCIFGIHGAYDTRHSEFGNNFHQATLGLELLDANWGLRWNGYLAGEGPKFIPALNSVSLVGNTLLIQQASERAYSGQDLEIETRLWYRDSSVNEYWQRSYGVEFWGALGYYNFDNDAPGFNHMSGPRARLEMRLFDVPLAGPDSRLVFGGQYEHDDVRGSVGSGMLTLRIPFGRGSANPRNLLRGLNRRMVAPIERNTDIISVAGLESAEAAVFANSGQAISQVVTIDANTINPELVIAAAGNNSLVIADGGAGTILPGSTINLQPGQVVIGGGSNLPVTAAGSGAAATFNAPGSRPTIDTLVNSTFNAGNNGALFAMNVQNSGNNLSGVLLNDTTGFLMDDVNIIVTGASSFGVQAIGTSQFAMNNSSISTSGLSGDGIQVLGNSQASIANTSIGTSGQDAEGIFVAQNGFLNLQGSQVFTSGSSGSEGILAMDSAQLIISSSTVSVIGPSTIGIFASPTLAADNLAMLISNTTINSTSHGVALGGAGFTAGALNASVLSNTISTPTGLNDIDVETNGAAVANLNIQGNSLDPLLGTIRLNEIGGDVNVTQFAPGTTADGIDAANGLPPTNILIPGNPIDFGQPPPVPPVAP